MLNIQFWRELAGRLVVLLTLGCLGLLIWIMVAALWNSAAHAAPAPPIEITLEQPEGETFPAQPFGDEWNNGYETPRGYTIVRDPESGTWEYATEGPQGSLEPSGKVVGLDARPNVPKHLRSEEPSDLQALEQALTLEAPALANPNSGTQRTLVILVQFQDQASLGSTPAQWNSRFFGDTNSVHDYYDEVSYGKLNIAPATESHGTANDGVVGWLTMTTNHPNTAGNTGTANRTLARDAVNAADPSVDYASYDSNGDGFLSSRELHVTVIVAGYEAGGWRNLGNSVWGHHSSLSATVRPSVDGVVFGDSGHGGGYTQFGEWHGDHMATIGTMVHEMGHDLYLPDLYDLDSTSAGVGNWSVMGTGGWLAAPGAHLGSTPAHLDAWSKSYEGWLIPQRLFGDLGIAQAETNATAMQLGDNPGGVDWTFNTSSGTGEYFLVENRQLTGYDAALPGCGLLVWHIDETRTSTNSANADETRRLVDLEEADGLNHLDGLSNRGDAGDPYPGSSTNTQFNDTSNPNSRLYSGSSSEVASENMSGPCSSTMSADLTVRVPPSTYSACFGLHPINIPTAGNDVIVGTAGPDVLVGGAGDDEISGLQGDDRLCGNEGNDKVRGNSGSTDRIDGGLGDDLLGGGEYLPGVSGPTCGRSSGSAGELSPADSPVFNTIYGGTGNDKILGGGGLDSMKGGDGNDCLMGMDSDDKLWGDSGADYISAGPGHDMAVGGNDYDYITGGGASTESGDGNDTLYAGSINSFQLPIWPKTCQQNGEFAFEAGPVETGEASVFFAKENELEGDDGYDILVGTNRTDYMKGGTRGDDLYGFGGTDRLWGNRASDCLSGGPNTDYLYDNDPYNVEPDDKDTLWGGGSFDYLNAKDGDTYDLLDGGVDSVDISPNVGVGTGDACIHEEYPLRDVVRNC